jgi:hypothetical protein
MGQIRLTPSVSPAVDQSGLVPFRKLFVVQQEHTFLNMPHAGADGHIRQPQETLRNHLTDFQCIKIVRFRFRQGPLDSTVYGFFPVQAENPCIDVSQVKQSPSD